MSKVLAKAIEDFKAIDSASGLKKNKLTLTEYHSLVYTLNEIIDNGVSYTFLEGVAGWCKRMGFNVVAPYGNNLNYKIEV